MDKKTEFLQKLKVLLAEYDAEIGFTCSDCSDTHGLSDDGMTISVDDTEIYRNWDWYITHSNIEE